MSSQSLLDLKPLQWETFLFWRNKKARCECLPLGARCVRFLSLATSLHKDIICSFEGDIFMLVFTRREVVRPFRAPGSSRYSCFTQCWGKKKKIMFLTYCFSDKFKFVDTGLWRSHPEPNLIVSTLLEGRVQLKCSHSSSISCKPPTGKIIKKKLSQ